MENKKPASGHPCKVSACQSQNRGRAVKAGGQRYLYEDSIPQPEQGSQGESGLATIVRSLDYGQRMKCLRQANGYRTQAELGELLGCPAGSISAAESGKRSYTLDEVAVMVDEWSIAPQEIYALFIEGLAEYRAGAEARVHGRKREVAV